MAHHKGVHPILVVTMEAEAAIAQYATTIHGTAEGQVLVTSGANCGGIAGIAQNARTTAQIALAGGHKMIDIMFLGTSNYIRGASTCTRGTWLCAEGADGHLKTIAANDLTHIVGSSLTTPDTDGDYGYVFLNIHDLYQVAA